MPASRQERLRIRRGEILQKELIEATPPSGCVESRAVHSSATLQADAERRPSRTAQRTNSAVSRIPVLS